MKPAIILAGGIGQRLRPMTDHFPKPLARIAERPLLEHVLHGLHAGGIDSAALATGYKAGQIEACFGRGEAAGIELRYILENEPLGSGGAVRNVADRLPELVRETFVVATADVLHSVDFGAAFEFHRATGALATIVCGRTENPEGLGILEIEDDGRVARFHEKPAPGVTDSRWGNLALWIFEPAVLEYLASGPSSIETELFPRLLELGLPLMAYRHPGYWLDVGTLPRYLQAQTDALLGRFPRDLKLRGGDRMEVDPPVLIAADCEVAADASLVNAVLGHGSRIEAGAQIRDSVLYAGAQIGSGASLQRCVVGPGYQVPAGSKWENTMLFESIPGMPHE